MITIEQLPVLDDNYIYAIDVDGDCFVIDPAEAPPVLVWLAEKPGRRLRAVLCTHHHGDHTGGNAALKAATGCRVIGPSHDLARIDGASEGAVVGDTVDVCGLRLRVLDVHAHTRGHIAYALDTAVDRVSRHGHGGVPTDVARLAGRPALFVGDSLFGAGCGRLFEGDQADLFGAMTTLAAEDPNSLVCCTHEYTLGNLRFAAAVMPEVPAIAERLAGFDAERGASRSSVPSTLAEELATNPFLLGLKAPDPAERVFELRQQKDTFRG